MTLFAGISPEISLLQAGFLAFTVYLSAVILRTLLRGKSLLKLYHWRRHSTGEDCIDGDHVDFAFNVLTISISIPSTLPPVSSMKETKEEMDLFNAEDLYGLVKCMQKSTQVSYIELGVIHDVLQNRDRMHHALTDLDPTFLWL